MLSTTSLRHRVHFTASTYKAINMLHHYQHLLLLAALPTSVVLQCRSIQQFLTLVFPRVYFQATSNFGAQLVSAQWILLDSTKVWNADGTSLKILHKSTYLLPAILGLSAFPSVSSLAWTNPAAFEVEYYLLRVTQPMVCNVLHAHMYKNFQ